MTPITPAALSNAQLLRRIGGAPMPSKLAILAAELDGKDLSNLRRAIKLLIDDGLVEGEPGLPGALQLTEAGQRVVQALAVAEGNLTPAEAPATWPRDRIRLNPLNARKHRDEAVTAARAENIAEHGLLQPVLLTPADASGVRMLLDGEGRCLSIDLLIADGRMAPNAPIPFLERDATPEEALMISLAANAGREDIDLLDRAEAFLTLVDSHGRSARQLALTLGLDVRMVQEAVKVAREASTEDKSLYQMGDLSFEDLRRSVRIRREGDEAPPAADTGNDFAAQVAAVTRQAAAGEQTELESTIGQRADLTPHEELVLVEIQAAAKARPAPSMLGPAAAISSPPAPLDHWPPEAELAGRGFIAFSNLTVTLLRPAVAYLARLKFTTVDEATRLREAREAAGVAPETIEELEAQDTFDRSWLNERNRPPKLTPAEALVLLELADARLGLDSGDTYYGVLVQPAASADPIVARLHDLNLIREPQERQHRLRLGFLWDYERPLDRYFAGWRKKKDRARILAALRAEVLGEAAARAVPADQYATAWLNGPFELSAEAKAAQEAERASQAARAAREDERIRQHNEHLERKAKLIADLTAAAPTLSGEALAQRFRETIEGLGYAGPFKVQGSWSLAQDSTGATVTPNDDGVKTLVVMALNIACGFDLAEADRPPQPLDRPAFEAAIVARLDLLTAGFSREALARLATQEVDELLRCDGIEFGDENYTWTTADAAEIAENMAESDLVDPGPAEQPQLEGSAA